MGVTPKRPVEANWGVRACVRAAGKALEGMTDKHTDRQNDCTGIIERL